ncbi:MAG: hypothetical protein J7M05_04295 [Anaerolineae bacterium]|nr:hypothetical protein [Anaerolineae bacterium]
MSAWHEETEVRPEVGRLVRLVGHDIRGKLGIIKNSVYYLGMKVDRENPKIAKHLGILEREIKACNDLVVLLMDWLAPKQPQKTPVDVNALLQEILGDYAPSGVQVTLALKPGLPQAVVDAFHLREVLESILRYRLAVLGEGDSLQIISRGDGPVYIDFIDSGDGFQREELDDLLAVEQRDELFPFRLGLAVAQRLLRLNGGVLEGESKKGIGTRLSVALPTS